LREWLYVEDLADALFLLLEKYDGEEILNIGSGEETTIRELAERVAEVVGYSGRLEWDTTKPDGTPRKVLDSCRLSTQGWKPKVSLRDGLRQTCRRYLKNYKKSNSIHL
jgi:GDP-L-fucose synthase